MRARSMLAFLVFLTALVPSARPAGDHLWSKRFAGSLYDDWAFNPGLAVDPQGNVIVTGTHVGTTLNLGAPAFLGPAFTSTGPDDHFLAKYSNTGLLLWAKRFGSSPTGGRTFRWHVLTDRFGNIYCHGGFTGRLNLGGGDLVNTGTVEELFLAKFSPEGRHLWSKHFQNTDPNEDQYLGDIAVDAAGNLYATGFFFGTLTFPGGSLVDTNFFGAIFLLKFSGNGALLWSKKFTPNGCTARLTVDSDSNGNVVLAGTFQTGINLGGATLTTTSATDNDVFLAKYSPQGAHLWSVDYGDPAAQHLEGMAVDRSGNILLAGIFHGTLAFPGSGCASLVDPVGTSTPYYPMDIFLVKLTPGSSGTPGTCLWAKSFGVLNGFNESSDQVWGMATDGSNNVILTGTLQDDLDFGGGVLTNNALPYSSDAFVAKFTSSGTHVFSMRRGGNGLDYGMDIAADSAGNIFVAGEFTERINFGATSATELISVNNGTPPPDARIVDMFVVKLSP